MGSQSSSQGGGLDVVPAAIGAVGNVASTIATNNANARENDETRAFNLKMWNMTNEYNSPQQQMARYMAAGLNPNLIYGSGGSSSGNASQPPAASPVKYNAPQLDFNLLGSLLQLAQLRLITQQTETEKAKTLGTQADSSIKSMLEQYYSYNPDIGKDWNALPKTASGDRAAMSNYWRIRDVDLQTKMKNLALMSANTTSAQTLADLNSHLRPYYMTANDNILARMGLLSVNKLQDAFRNANGASNIKVPNLLEGLWNFNKNVGLKGLGF